MCKFFSVSVSVEALLASFISDGSSHPDLFTGIKNDELLHVILVKISEKDFPFQMG